MRYLETVERHLSFKLSASLFDGSGDRSFRLRRRISAFQSGLQVFHGALNSAIITLHMRQR